MRRWYFCCTDFSRASGNREMVKKKLNIWAYLQVENWLATNPRGDMPGWVLSDGFTYSPQQAGRKGGLARAAKMTPRERSESARHAINKRWHT